MRDNKREVFKVLWGLQMHLISSPFTFCVDNAPSDVQLELISLRPDMLLAENFKSVSLLDFYISLSKMKTFPA